MEVNALVQARLHFRFLRRSASATSGGLACSACLYGPICFLCLPDVNDVSNTTNSSPDHIKASAVHDSSDAVKASSQPLIHDFVLYNPKLDPFFLILVFWLSLNP